MTRTRSLLLVTALLVASSPGLAAAVQSDVMISTVDVSPSEPVPGDEVTIESTIENADSVGFFVDKVTIEEATDDEDVDPEVYDKVLDIGSIGAGDSRQVPLTTAFDAAGSYDLRVKVWGRASDGGQRTRIQFPVSVEVRDRSPLVDIDVNESVVGVQSEATVTLANRFSDEIEDVQLAVDGESMTITNKREVVGAVGSGQTRAVEFGYRPASPGAHALTTTVTYRRPSGTLDTVTASTTVRAESVKPLVDVSVNDSTAGFAADGTVEVANGVGADLRNVEVTVDSEDANIRNDRAVYTRIPDGEAVTTSFEFAADEAGPHEVTARLSYTTGDGTVRQARETVSVTTEPVADRVSLEVSSVQRTDSQDIVVDVINQGNGPVENVSVRGSSPNATIRGALLGRVPSGESGSVRLNTTLSADRATVDVAATYDLGNRQGRSLATTNLTRTPGRITLTGVEVVPEDDRLRISGSASNLGTSDAQSVLVRVRETERITPSEPAREFFVGTVPASDFVSFDVYATTDGNVSTIPLAVSYLVDDDRRTRTVDVDARAGSAALAGSDQARENGADGPPLVPIAFGLLVALVVIAIMVRAWRASRGSD